MILVVRRVLRVLRRLIPMLVAGYRRWQQLPDHEKARRKQQAADAAARTRNVASRAGRIARSAASRRRPR